MTDMSLERLARVEAWKESHEKSDDERYGGIQQDYSQILSVMSEIKQTLERSTQRIHDRIDVEAKTSASHTSAVNENAENAHHRINGLKVWFLGGAVTFLVAVIGFAADKMIQ